jgi:hypothetical protein
VGGDQGAKSVIAEEEFILGFDILAAVITEAVFWLDCSAV